MTDNILTLLKIPRELAIELLHAAQIAQAPLSARIFAPTEPAGAWRWLRGAGDIAESGVWAAYRFDPAQPGALPIAADFTTSAALHLMPVLTTKGVLQLRIWRCENGSVVECPLALAD